MKLHIFPASPRARKAIMTNAHLGLGIPLSVVDITTGAHKQPAFLALNPNGRVPVLEFDDGSTLSESNAIVNRLAAEVDTPIWPKTNARYDIMQWQFWEGSHWTPACGKFIAKHIFKDDSIDMAAAEEETRGFATVLNDHLSSREWLVGDEMTTADISVSAILAYRAPCHYPLDGFTHIHRWLAQIEALPSWQEANPA